MQPRIEQMKINIQKLFDDILGLADKIIPDATKKHEFKLKMFEIMAQFKSKAMINVITIWILAMYSAFRLGILKTFDVIDFTILFAAIGFQFGIDMVKLAGDFKDFLKKKEK